MRRSIKKYGTLIPVAAVLAAYSGPAYADVVDADVVSATTGNQTSRDLGVFQPGEVRTLPLADGVSFTLRCSGNQHVERNQSVTMKLSSAFITPTGGAKSATTLLRATDSARPASRQTGRAITRRARRAPPSSTPATAR